MRKSKKKLLSVLMISALAMGLTTGCTRKVNSQVSVIHDLNEGKTYETAVVEKGVLSSDYSFMLIMQGYARNMYNVSSSYQFDKLYVKEGDYVHEGDLLLKFKTEDAETGLESYKQQIEENKLLIEHYTNLMKADKSLDYSDEIEILKDDNELNELYIKQYETKMGFFEIRAKKDAYITYVDDNLLYDYVETGKTLITGITGSDTFVTTTEEDYPFEVGQKVEALSLDGKLTFELTVTAVNKDETGKSVISFKSPDEKIVLKSGERLRLNIESDNSDKEECYVESTFVFSNDDNNFVYIMDEEGHLSVRDVKVGRAFKKYLIISEGLNEGEKVAKF